MRSLCDTPQKLYDNQELQGRGLIRKFIIRNTYEPKYKVGDYVKVTDDTRCYILGNRIVNVNARVDEISWWLNDKGKECIHYDLYAIDQFGKDHFLCAEESIDGSYQARRIVGKSKTDKNTFKTKCNYDSCEMTI